MEVTKTYQEFLLQLLNKEENINLDNYQEELIVNLYLTLLSLSNIEFSEDIDKVEKDQIEDFLRKLNNLKVKIQLKRKEEEINKLSEELINQYYENINILTIYINNGKELENIINSKDSKRITTLIDIVTKDKMDKDYNKENINNKRKEIIKLLPSSNYYIKNNIIYINNNDTYEEISLKDFIEMFNYLLNPDNYKKTYNNQQNQNNHELIIANIIKLIIIKDKKIEELEKILIPVTLTYVLSSEKLTELDTTNFNVENIKITELYSFASQTDIQSTKTAKWRNISIPNDYLINKLKHMIKNGMYYYKDESFVLENIENNNSDFKVSIHLNNIIELLKTILEPEKVKTKSL